MDRNSIKFFINVGLLLTFAISLTTGIIKFPLITRHFNFVYMVVPAHSLNTLHDWSGVTMSILVLYHLILNWNWIVKMTKKMVRGGI